MNAIESEERELLVDGARWLRPFSEDDEGETVREVASLSGKLCDTGLSCPIGEDKGHDHYFYCAVILSRQG